MELCLKSDGAAPGQLRLPFVAQAYAVMLFVLLHMCSNGLMRGVAKSNCTMCAPNLRSFMLMSPCGYSKDMIHSHVVCARGSCHMNASFSSKKNMPPKPVPHALCAPTQAGGGV